MMRRIVALFAICFACAFVPAQASVRAWLDRTEAAEGEAVTLNIETDEAASPDFSPLRADFDIVEQSSSKQMQWVNGAFSAKTLYAASLLPKHGGRIAIPPLRVGTQATPPLSVTVRAASAASPGTNADVFLQTEVDDPNPYVQQTVGVTVRLYHAVTLTGQLDLAAPDGAALQQVGNDAQSTRTVNGRSYNVFERHYLLVPDRSGALTLPAPRFAGRGVGGWIDEFLGDGRRELRISGTPRTLQVKPQPANAPQPWLPLRDLRLRYVSAPQSVRAGEAMTLTVEAVAVGATRAQLPDLPAPSVPGAQVFAEPQQYDETFRNGVPQVVLTRRYSVVPDGSGTLRIAGMRMAWWDVRAGAAKTATLPDLDVKVTPGNGGFANRRLPPPVAPGADAAASANGTADAAPIPAHVWTWLAVFFAVLWLATLIWAVWRRHGGAPADAASSQSAAARRPTRTLPDLRRALDTGTLDEIGETLRAMASPPVADLDALLARLDDTRQREAIETMRRARWADGDGSAARAVLRAAFKNGPKWKPLATQGKEILPPLYPE